MGKDRSLIKLFFKIFKPKWSLVLIGGLGTLFISLMQIPGPFLSQYIIDHAIPKKSAHLIFIISFILLGLIFIKSTISLLNNYILEIFKEKLLLNLRLSMINHILSLPLSFFKEKDPGYILSRITNDTYETQGIFADNLLTIISNILTFLIGIFALFYIHWKLALISIILLPIYVFSGNVTGYKIRRHSAVIQENASILGKLLGEVLLGIFTIKIFAKEEESIHNLKKLLEKNYRDNIKMSIIRSINSIFSSFLGGFGMLIVLGYGALEIINGRLTIGKLVAFNSFLSYLYNPLSVLIGINAQFQRSISAIKRILEIISIPVELDKGGSASKETILKLKKIRGEVIFQNISFSYNDKEEVLKNINFEVKPGEVIAIVGRSGAGKTSLVNLLLRIYEPTRGSIFIDGIDITKIPIKHLRETIGYVSQDPFLFHGSIIENIKFAKKDASDNEVFKAVRLSGLHDILQKLSLDYNDDVGVLGTKLSGGQKQIVSIARVFLKDPKLLIFDEATSNLDYETENILKKAINNLTKGRTSFIIAHRLSTILRADRIFVLDKGKIIETGTHSELYSRNGIYTQLFNEQFSELQKLENEKILEI
ncbi:MAG: ABC transporter ATP-binding protein [Candidatus Altiarchaeota archaeon]